MTRNDIYLIIKKNVEEILPEIPSNNFDIDDKFKNLGANSIDRMEILTLSLEQLGIKVPLVDIGVSENIKEMVEKIYMHCDG